MFVTWFGFCVVYQHINWPFFVVSLTLDDVLAFCLLILCMSLEEAWLILPSSEEGVWLTANCEGGGASLSVSDLSFLTLSPPPDVLSSCGGCGDGGGGQIFGSFTALQMSDFCLDWSRNRLYLNQSNILMMLDFDKLHMRITWQCNS